MLLKHQFSVSADQEEVWGALTDLSAVAECFPGARLNSATGGVYTGEVGFKVGPIGVSFDGRAEFLERDSSAKRAVVKAVGTDKRGNGGASATVTMQVSGGGGKSEVSLETDLDISGKPAQFGRGLLQEVSERLLRQFVECMEVKLAGGDSGSSGAVSDGISRRGDQQGQTSAGYPAMRAEAFARVSSKGVFLKFSDVGYLVAFAAGAVWGTMRVRRMIND